MAYVDLWGWFDTFYRQAARAGDGDRQRLVLIYDQAWKLFETDPQRGMALLDQGLALATALDEPCWKLFYDYWRCETYVFYLNDLDTGLSESVRMIVEARKPQYSQCPVLGRAYRILLDAYVFIDPIGYEDKIRETLDYMQSEIALDYDTRCLLEARRIRLTFALDRLDEAHEQALQYLAISASSSYRRSHAYSILSHFNFLKGEFDLALDYIRESEACARRSHILSAIAQALAWQALLARMRGEEEDAWLFYRRATAQMAQLGTTPSGLYYDALCEYHEINGDAEHALQLRDQELADVLGVGTPHAECEVRLKRCRLLGRMGGGAALEAALAETRENAKALLKPAHFLSKFDRVAAGDYAEPLRTW